jgi:hypothetical protein
MGKPVLRDRQQRRNPVKKTARSLTNKDLMSLMPPRLDFQNLGWVPEEYWDDAGRSFVAQTRNSYHLQIHKPMPGLGKGKGPQVQLIGRLILYLDPGVPLAWAECEGTQNSYFKLSLLIRSQDPQNSVWLDQGKAATELLLSAIAILLEPDQVTLTALDPADLETLAGWNLGTPKIVWSPVVDALYRTTPEPLAMWRYFTVDLTQFKDSERGHNLRKSLNYLQLRKSRTIKATEDQCRPARRRRGFLARIFRPKS